MTAFVNVLRASPIWLLVPLAAVLGVAFSVAASRASPLFAAAGIVGVCGFLALYRWPYLGLLITAMVVPIERFGRFTDDSAQTTVSLMRLIGVAALGALLLHNMLHRKGFHVGSSLLLYGTFTALAIVGVSWSTDFAGTVRACGAILGNLLFLFLVINLIDSRKRVIQAITLWLIASVAVAIYSGYDWHFGSGTETPVADSDFDPGAGVQSTATRFQTVWQDQAEYESLGGLSLRRSMGPTSHAAVYGINLIMTIPFLLLLLRLQQRWWIKAGITGGILVILYNTLLTNTRAVILLTGLVVLMCVWRRLLAFRREYVAPVLFAAAAVLPILPEDLYNRILDPSNYSFEKSKSISIRAEYAQAGLRAIGDNFILGVGVGNQEAVPRYLTTSAAAPEVTTTHNIYIQIFMETGIVGGLLFFGFVIQLLVFSFRAGENFRRIPGYENEYWVMVACQVCMISVLIFGLQVDVFNFPLKGWWLVAGIVYVLYIHSGAMLRRHGTASGSSAPPPGTLAT